MDKNLSDLDLKLLTDSADTTLSGKLFQTDRKIQFYGSGLKPGPARPTGLTASPARPKNQPGREAANVSAAVTATMASDQRTAAVASREQVRN